MVPADAPIVTYVPGTRDELKPGAKVMIFNAVKQPDGSVQAASRECRPRRAHAADVISRFPCRCAGCGCGAR